MNFKKELNIFLIGPGLIGSTLLEQIKNSSLPWKVCGLANSKKVCFNPQGINLKNWKKELAAGDPLTADEFLTKIIHSSLSHRVIVDCTASENIAKLYARALQAKIPLVTPNKKANSGPLAYYKKLQNLAEKNKTPFLYDANVGAGLPIISSLQNFVKGQDKIIKIEGALSGTLSYIFSSFARQKKKFSEIVREAQEKGFTEPDPRDDLNGQDAARKILILAREAGLDLELEQVKIEPLLSSECQQAPDLNHFFTALAKMDNYWEKRKKQAQKEKKIIHYIAKLENNKASLRLQKISQGHPFYCLSGSDNIVSFFTKNYSSQPLVIRGPGAGAAVTANKLLVNLQDVAHYYSLKEN